MLNDRYEGQEGMDGSKDVEGNLKPGGGNDGIQLKKVAGGFPGNKHDHVNHKGQQDGAPINIGVVFKDGMGDDVLVQGAEQPHLRAQLNMFVHKVSDFVDRRVAVHAEHEFYTKVVWFCFYLPKGGGGYRYASFS